jgi:predicted DNA-binding transcriptional regulator AlpA
MHDDDLRVLTIQEWCALTGISEATGKRLLRDGDGPAVIQLSARRIGIRTIDHSRWLAERMRS